MSLSRIGKKRTHAKKSLLNGLNPGQTDMTYLLYLWWRDLTSGHHFLTGIRIMSYDCSSVWSGL